MKRTVLILIGLMTTMLLCSAEDVVDGFIARDYTNAAGAAMPYRLFIPSGYDNAKAYPLVIWLHGGGGIGTDNVRQLMNDQIPGTRIWTAATNQDKHPAFVLVPQTPRCWDPTGYPGIACNEEIPHGADLSPELLQVAGMLKSIESEFNIDTKRIYVAGQSIGGFGAWNLVTKRPDLFAAAIVLCGGGDPALAPRAKNVAIWSFQGDADDPQLVASNRAMIAALQKAGAKPRYTEYPGMGHDIWDTVFNEPNLVDWLFAQHK
jgi:predicted peptidase